MTNGQHAGRIGNYDDDDDTPFRACVYFGHPLQARGYYLVDKRYLKEPTIGDLFNRYSDIQNEVFRGYALGNDLEILDYQYFCSILVEGHYIYTELEHRNLQGKFGKTKTGKRIYLAHSSNDKGVVRMIHDDLKALGHAPWIDEQQILVGESIIEKLQKGLVECDYLLLLMSKSAEKSIWVKVEWETKFWEEINKRKISVLPALLEECQLPPILASKKYANFSESYNDGLEQVLTAIGHKQKRTTAAAGGGDRR